MKPPRISTGDRRADSGRLALLTKQRTSFIIAHRLSTIRGRTDPGASQGKNPGRRDHDELMQKREFIIACISYSTVKKPFSIFSNRGGNYD
jgi:hypothetical protein